MGGLQHDAEVSGEPVQGMGDHYGELAAKSIIQQLAEGGMPGAGPQPGGTTVLVVAAHHLPTFLGAEIVESPTLGVQREPFHPPLITHPKNIPPLSCLSLHMARQLCATRVRSLVRNAMKTSGSCPP